MKPPVATLQKGRIQSELLVGGALTLTLGLVAVQGSGQDTIAVAVLLVSLPLVMTSPYARVLVLMFGGLLAFQSSLGVGLLKSTYLGVTLIALLSAITRLITFPDRRAIALMKPMVVAGALFAGVVALSLAVAIAAATPLSDWLRDAAPYFLFCTVPIFALDFSAGVPRRYLISVLIAAGVLAALSFAVEWAGVNRRQLFQLPIDHLLLPSALLSIALVCFSTSSAITSRGIGRVGWIALTGALVAVLAMLTGTRSFLVLVLVPLMVSLAAPGKVVARTMRVAVFTVMALAAGLGITLLVLQVTSSSPLVLIDRFASVEQLLSNPAQDFSYQMRLQQFDSAVALFQSSPLIGAGPGHLFYWPGATGKELTTFNVDTGMALPAKFGLMGVAALVAIAVALLVVLRRMAVTIRGEASWLALPAFAIVGTIWFLLGAPLEDKGFSFGMILLLALALADYQESVPAPEIAGFAAVTSHARATLP